MSKLEDPMILQYWEAVGGTLITEFQAVPRSDGVGRRLIDAVILPALPKRKAHWRDLSIENQDVLAIQAKAHRLGMYVMGQAIFSARLIRQRFKPRSVRGVILCSADDQVLRPLLAEFPDIEVVVIPSAPVLPSEEETGQEEIV